MLEIPLISPWMKSFPHWNACPGSPVINRMAEENPLETTEYSPERAEPIPETIRWKADTAASRREEAIFTTVVLIPFQTEDAVCFIADQIREANWDRDESTVSTPCFSPKPQKSPPDGFPTRSERRHF